MESIASFFGFMKKSKSTPTHSSHHGRNVRDAIVISFEDRYYDLDFRHIQGGLNTVTIAELKERCKQITGVTIATMKLKVSGAFIKDDTATLMSSGIHNGCIVYVMGEKANSEQLKQTASGNPEEVGYMIRISKIMEKIDLSKNKIVEFKSKVALISQHQDNNEPIDNQLIKHVEDLGAYLSEILMQALIALDGVDCPPEFETARANRRQGVKHCQALMDHVDQSRANLKQLNNKQKL